MLKQNAWSEYTVKYEKVAEGLNEELNDTSKENVSIKINNGFASFRNLSVMTTPHPNEIHKYLTHAVENVKDPLKWWVKNKYVYPRLYCMALDYLSIHATSTSVE